MDVNIISSFDIFLSFIIYIHYNKCQFIPDIKSIYHIHIP